MRAVAAAGLAVLFIAACGTPSVADRGSSGDDERSAPDGAPTVTPTAAPQMTPCAAHTQVVIWGLRQWGVLADAFEAAPADCGEYHLSLPPVVCDGEKRCPRGPLAPQEIRDRGPQFHAVAEFHWGAWSRWVQDHPGKTFEDAGREFRKLMDDANYDVEAGDSWAINELPSSVRSGVGPARANAMAAIRGLHAGPAGVLPVQGAVFTIGMGQQTTNFSVYKPNLKGWVTDATFWNAMDGRVRFWAQEAYPDPRLVCVAGSTVGQRSRRTNEFTQHVARLAVAGPGAADKAQTFFDKAYVPLLNASWQQNDTGFGTTTIPASEMSKFIAVEVYANKAWAKTHAYPDRRIGFAWAPAAEVTAPELAPIAKRMAESIRDGYAPGNAALDACNPAGTASGCQCSVSGAAFTAAWETFASY